MNPEGQYHTVPSSGGSNTRDDDAPGGNRGNGNLRLCSQSAVPSVLFVVVSASPVTVATVVYDVVTVNSVTVDLYVSPLSTDVLFVVEMRNYTF